MLAHANDATCDRHHALWVKGFGDIGHEHLPGVMPMHFSHLLRNWLPRFFACVSTSSAVALAVPRTVPSARPLYQHIVDEFKPGMQVVECSPSSFSSSSSFFSFFSSRNNGLERCTHSADLLTYYASYKQHRLVDCRSADVVFVNRSSDPRLIGLARSEGTSRRSIRNLDAVWATVHEVAHAHSLTAESVTFEQLPLASQRRKTCSARVVIGQHGAGLAHALWSSHAPVAVVELPPWNKAWWADVFKANGIIHMFTEAPSAHHINRSRGMPVEGGVATIDLEVLTRDLRRALRETSGGGGARRGTPR